MKTVYSKGLAGKYKWNIFANILILLLISTLSIAAPLVIREAVDYETGGAFSPDMIGLYFVILSLLYVAKFIYNRFKFWFAKKVISFRP